LCRCFKYETAEEILEALEKDGSEFALKSKRQILEASPTSIKITLEAYRLGKIQSMKDCLGLENHVSQIIFVSLSLIVMAYIDLFVIL
jgi:3-hydroxyisobutyryl-CoA hydrolase